MTAFKAIRFGKYLLLDKIAIGGMAELYRAKITGVQGFEKFIAVKKVLPHLTVEKELINSFIDEAKLAALLNHQNIVQIYDFGSMEGSYFIAMEYLSGKDLHTIANNAKEKGLPLSIEYSLYISSQICAGLDYAHKLNDFQGKPLNLIHRDISPHNILITYEGTVKIVDFGIAKAATQTTMTQAGMIKGKVAYMSPEQAEGKSIDHRSDIFSTGILLYEMVTGRRMFEGDTLKILSLVRKAEFKPPEEARSDLPAKLYEIIYQALAKDPDQRYRSCGEMLADLEEYIYEQSMRPTAQGLAQYMKELFEEEIASEEQAMREADKITVAGEPKPDKDAHVIKKKLDKARVIVKEKVLEKRRKQVLWYGALAAALFVIVMVFTFWSEEETVPTDGKVVSVSPTQPFDSEPPDDTAAKDIQKEGPSDVESPSPVPSPTQQATVHGATESDKLAEGMKALKEERFAKAAVLFEEVLTGDPSMIEEVAGPYSLALQSQASSLVEKDPQNARSLLVKAVELDPRSAQGHFQLGRLYMKQDDYANAAKSYEKVAELDPEFPDAFFNLGYIYARNKDYTRAEEMYTQVVKLSPSYLDEALFNLAMVQEKQGKKGQCIENLERALNVNPDNKIVEKYLSKLKRDSGEDQ